MLCLVCVGRTDSLGRENLGEAGREGDEDYGVGDPGQILQKHVTVQTTVHPLLCCGHTHTQPGQTCKPQSKVSSNTQYKIHSKKEGVHAGMW